MSILAGSRSILDSLPKVQKPARRMNVLVIAYYFPPMGLSGVQRTLKFVKYLPEFGWRPIVLTSSNVPYYAQDSSLLDEIQPLIDEGSIRIVRTGSSGAPAEKLVRKEAGLLKLPRASYQRIRTKVIQTFLQPDSRILWKKPALEAAEKIFAEENIDAIMATAPPFTSFLVAKELRKKHGTPFLMDYRDAWVANPVLNFYATPFHKAYARKLEDECLRASDAVTVVNRKMKEVLIRDYSFLSHEDVSILAHGYDPEDIERALPQAQEMAGHNKFRLTYAGAFYVGRSPKTVLLAAKKAMAKDPELKDDLELLFAGVLQKEYHKLIKKLGLESVVTEKGYLDHCESVATLLASDVLWMTMSDDMSAPGKLYEYFGTRKPILGLVPKASQAERLLQEYGSATCVGPDDVDGTASAILDLYHRWKQGSPNRQANEDFVQGYDRRALTKDLSKQLAMITRV